ncbi:MAG: HNH endonuclease [Tannerellaceae bacterium]|nr:HNH endonuclease [Tannerellaceae bacterium]
MQKEIWKDVAGYEGLYQVSNLGRVKSIPRKVTNGTGGEFFTKPKIMNRHKDTSGYHAIALCKNSKMKKTKLHRIIAKAFIPNPDNKPQVDHINGIRTDNRLSNLRWVTPSENNKNGYRNGNKKVFKPRVNVSGKSIREATPVSQYSQDGIKIMSFDSIHKASKHTGIPISSISNACKKQRKTSHGYVWKYSTPDNVSK